MLVIEGVGFSHAMLRIAAAFYGVQWEASQMAGLIGTLSAQLSGADKTVERILLDSVETREMFKEAREAIYKAAGIVDDSAQHPDLHIHEKITDFDALMETIKAEVADGSNRVYEQKEAGVMPAEAPKADEAQVEAPSQEAENAAGSEEAKPEAQADEQA